MPLLLVLAHTRYGPEKGFLPLFWGRHGGTCFSYSNRPRDRSEHACMPYPEQPYVLRLRRVSLEYLDSLFLGCRTGLNVLRVAV